jgi:hypothetical protein
MELSLGFKVSLCKVLRNCGHHATEHQDRLHRKLKGTVDTMLAVSGQLHKKLKGTVDTMLAVSGQLHRKLKGTVDTMLCSTRADYTES